MVVGAILRLEPKPATLEAIHERLDRLTSLPFEPAQVRASMGRLLRRKFLWISDDDELASGDLEGRTVGVTLKGLAAFERLHADHKALFRGLHYEGVDGRLARAGLRGRRKHR